MDVYDGKMAVSLGWSIPFPLLLRLALTSFCKSDLKWNSKPSNSFSFGLAFEFNGLRSRNHRVKRYLKLPKHRRDLQIPDAFRTTTVGEDFLLWQSASRHILVFPTGSNIKLQTAKRTWGMDGRFKTLPQWYQQLFTIHVFVAVKLFMYG
ncbi:hypothetical protein T11_543 [Trichinella zimbabwensis]|uniref:Uncharacterized protein n=1 Tax=Trichinella zimbabwensis TaxID=268475 RepID=A0A0V1HHC5_9BILA|nr:hypothetical protein T11_543 [Trichinella zimbabwensis]